MDDALSNRMLDVPIPPDQDDRNTRRWKVFALAISFLPDANGRARLVLTGPTEWDEGEALSIIESMRAGLKVQGKAGNFQC